MDIKINTHVQQGIIEVVKPEVLAILSVSLCFTTKSQGDFADSFSLFLLILGEVERGGQT